MTDKIEWTLVPDGRGGFKIGETLNPQVGCREISPACRNCYAAKLAGRDLCEQHVGLTRKIPLLGPDGVQLVDRKGRLRWKLNSLHWNGEIKRKLELLAKPLHWTKPRGIFWGSMTDLFYKVDTEADLRFIAAIFGICAATPQHTHILLTKRPGNAANFFAWLSEQCKRDGVDQVEWCVQSAGEILLDAGAGAEAEQLFDRYGWASQGDYYGGFEAMERDDVPGIERRKRRAQLDTEGWDAEAWPARNIWMGVTAEDQQRADERIQVLLGLPAAVRFVSYEPACGPIDLRRWIERLDHCGACEEYFGPQSEDVCPECGSDYGLITTWGYEQADRYRSGERYADDGPHADDDGPQLHWVIAGGESGHGARPPHPDWFRSARDQCVQAGVSYFFKQWGEWAEVARDDDSWTHMVSLAGKASARGDEMPFGDVASSAFMRKVGKKAAGRMLDGRTWDEFPESQ